MPAAGVIALIDGEHHPAAVREALDALDRERGLAGVLFCGGGEKLPEGPLERHYGRPVRRDPAAGLHVMAGAAAAVVDLADEPALPTSAKLRLAALALHLGLSFESPGMTLRPPPSTRLPFDVPVLAVIGTGKRTGKTALAGHWAGLMRARGLEPVVVCTGRGGPAEPRIAEPGTSLDDLLALAERGEHAASDYLENAVLAGVRTVGCRRVGGGPAGEAAATNALEAARLALSLAPGAVLLEGSGACIPPVEADRTVCLAGAGMGEPLAELRLLRAQLVLAPPGAALPAGCPPALRFALRAEPAEPVAAESRVALFTTGARSCEGVEPRVVSTGLARRGTLERDLRRAADERCDVYLTELKAAAIDVVAARARRAGARVVFVRNRPVGLDGDLDRTLMELVG